MSDRSLKGPDERREIIGKDTTRTTVSGHGSNKQKPDDVKNKGEIHSHHHHEHELDHEHDHDDDDDETTEDER